MKLLLFVLGAGLVLAACSWRKASSQPNNNSCAIPPGAKAAPTPTHSTDVEVQKTDAEWKQQLTPEQYYILRGHGTERAGSGQLLHNHETGDYTCAGCGAVLFKSDTKFDSGSGWPSFWQSADQKVIRYIEDTSYGMRRVEVRCARCDGHLGHVFEDGPAPTGKRFCINSAALKFTPKP